MHAGSQIQLLRRPLKFHWIAGCLNADGQRVGSRSVKGPTAGTPGLRPFNTARIPNGFYVSYVSRPDVAFLSREIYEDLLYFKHGIKLEEGDTVIDVGGNIGMFANHCAELVGPQGRVICAEPIPQVFTVLEDNIIRHHRWCVERGLPSALPEALNCGIGSCDGDEVEFTFYGSAAGWSTMYENAMEVEDAMGVFLEHSIGQGQGVEPSLVASMGRRLRRWTPQPVWNLAWRTYVRHMLQQKTTVVCPLRSLTSIMSDMALSHVSPAED
eukprot:jgi/Botrbrau1/6340/Bobra.0339s0046.1